MIVPLANWSAEGWRSQRFGESGEKSDEVDVVVMRERGLNLLPDSIDEGCEFGLRLSAGRSKPHEPVPFIHLTVPFKLCHHAVGRLGRVEGFVATSSVRLTARLNSELSICHPRRPTSECSSAGAKAAFGHRPSAERSLNTAEAHR